VLVSKNDSSLAVILSSKYSLSSRNRYRLSIERFTAKLPQSAPTTAKTCVISYNKTN